MKKLKFQPLKIPKLKINRRLMRRWSLAYVIMAAAAIITLIISASHTVYVLRENLIYTSDIQLDITRIRIDSTLSFLRQITAEAGSSTEVLLTAELDKADSSWDRYQLTKTVTSFEGQSGNEVYLYFPRNELMVSDKYYGDSQNFYQHEVAGRGISFEDFQSAVSGKYASTRIFAVSPGRDSHDGYLIFVRPVNVMNRRLSGCNAVMIFDLNQLVKASEWLEKSDLCIVDRNQRSIIGNVDLTPEMSDTILDTFLDNTRNQRTSRFTVGGKVVAGISSDYENWDFCVLTEAVNYMQQVKLVILLSVFLIVVYVVLFSVIIMSVYRRRYTSISKTINAFAGSDSLNKETPDSLPPDAYEYIDSHIRQLVSKNMEDDDLLQRQRLSIRHSVYHQLLYQRDASRQFERDILQECGLVIEENQPCLLLRYKIQKSETPSLRADLKDFILKNVTEETITEAGLSFLCLEEDKEEIIYVVWKSGELLSGTSLTDLVCEAEKKTKTFVTDQFHIGYESAISDEHHGVAGIHREYGETEAVLTYRKENESPVVCYRDLKRMPEDRMPQYPVEMENRLMHCIHHGDEAGADDQIREVLTLNRADLLPGEKFEYLASRIAEDILRAGRRVADDPMVIYRHEMLVTVCHDHSQDRDAAMEALTDLTRVVCQKITETAEREKESGKGNLHQDIVDWISANYADPELNAAMAADHFSMTPAVFSKYFKQKEGDTPSHFITSLRLYRAKEELLKGKTVEEVSEACGFASKRTFLRVFKQYEGVTPSQYRDLHAEENGHDAEK